MGVSVFAFDTGPRIVVDGPVLIGKLAHVLMRWAACVTRDIQWALQVGASAARPIDVGRAKCSVAKCRV